MSADAKHYKTDSNLTPGRNLVQQLNQDGTLTGSQGGQRLSLTGDQELGRFERELCTPRGYAQVL